MSQNRQYHATCYSSTLIGDIIDCQTATQYLVTGCASCHITNSKNVLIKDRTFSSLNFSFSQTNSQLLPVGLNLLFFFSGFLATSSSGLPELFNTVLLLVKIYLRFFSQIKTVCSKYRSELFITNLFCLI